MNIPPIHPALVHMPIAFVTLSVVADFIARRTRPEPRRATLRLIGFWTLVAGLAGGVLTIIAGYVDMNRAQLAPETQNLVSLHLTLGWLLAGTLVVLTAWRWLIWHRGQMTINTSYLVAATLVLGLTLFQGWYGSEMVYSYGAGVAATGQGTEDLTAARSRLAGVHNLLQPGTALGGGESPGSTNESRGKSSAK